MYSGGRDQEDCGSRSDQAKSSRDPISKKKKKKKPITKKSWQSCVGPGFKPSTMLKKKKKPPPSYPGVSKWVPFCNGKHQGRE
jgi:hypothetical protein